jgi:hypothetical protein
VEKLDWLLSLPAGATHAANYKKENFAEVTSAATGGKGVDLIIDMVGQGHFIRNLDALATDGRMTMLSLISGSHTFYTLSSLLTCIQNLDFRLRSSKFGPPSNPVEAPPHPGLHSTLAVNRIQSRGCQEVSDRFLTAFYGAQHSYGCLDSASYWVPLQGVKEMDPYGHTSTR